MSSGQKAWAEDCAADVCAEHIKRLEAIGYAGIAEAVIDIQETLWLLEGDIASLPRSGWYRLDRLKDMAKKLGR